MEQVGQIFFVCVSAASKQAADEAQVTKTWLSLALWHLANCKWAIYLIYPQTTFVPAVAEKDG